MTLRDRLLDVDSRIGVPRNADEAFDQNVRYWWVGVAASAAILVLVLVAMAFGWWAAAGMAIFVPFFAFASGYYYAHRLAALEETSSWFDRRSGDSRRD